MNDDNIGTGSVKYLWSIPIILSIHNLEEALSMPQWMSAHLPMLRSTMPIFEHLRFSSTQLSISLSLVTLIPLLMTFVCLRGERSVLKMSILLILQTIIFWNALIPHAIGVVVLGMYNPGTITAVFLNIPFSIYLYRRVKREGIVPEPTVKKIFIAGLVLYLPAVYVNHLIAEAISFLV
jgi:hypothetical protein